MKSLFCVVICSILISSIGIAAAFDNFEQQKVIVDAHAESPRYNIDDMKAFTLQQLAHDVEFRAVKDVLSDLVGLTKLGEIPGKVADYSALSDAQKMFVHAYAAMHLTSVASLTLRDQIILAGRMCSLMLSKELLLPDARKAIREHSYQLIKQEDDFLEEIMDISVFDRRRDAELMLKRMAAMTGFVTVPEKKMLPLVLLPPHNVFNFKTFLYAVSRGISLFGLDDKPFLGHGGVFLPPLLAFAHDKGHDDELGEGNALDTQAMFVDDFMNKLKHGFFKDCDKAIYAAFILLHETQIKTFASTPQDLPAERKIRSLFQAVRHRFGADEFKKYDAAFTKAFFSDLAHEIIKVQPELEMRIFPRGVDQDYDLAATIDAHGELVMWLNREYFKSEVAFAAE